MNIEEDNKGNKRVYQPNKAYGLYLGYCEQNDDPLVMGRIKVRIPEFHGPRLNNPDAQEQDSLPVDAIPWALPCFRNKGEYAIPEVGDPVWVAPEGTDIDRWVWLGVIQPLFNKDSIFGGNGDQSTVPIEAKQSLRASNKKPQVREFKTTGGHYVILDDAPGKQRIEIHTANGHIIKLDDNSGKVTIHSTGDADVTVTGKATVDVGDEADITVGGDVKLVASGNVEVTSPFVKLHNSVIFPGNIVTDNPVNNDPITGIPLQGNTQNPVD